MTSLDLSPSMRRQEAAAAASSPLRDTLRNILRQRSAVIGLAILAMLLLVAIFADIVAPFRPEQTLFDVPGAVRLSPPCIHLLGCPESQPQFLMGIDQNNRDLFSRVIHGSRVSLQVGLLTVSFAIVVGTLIGAVAGYAGGWADNILMRIMDVVLAFPALVLAIFLVTAFDTLEVPILENPLTRAMFAIGIVGIPVYARVMRSSVLSIRERDFVTASRAMGESGSGILLRRILPTALPPLGGLGTLGSATAILVGAALWFRGWGAQEPTPEWGSMIGAVRNQVFSAPHLLLFPGGALALSVLAFNLLGDGLRDAMDPRLNR